MKIKDICVEITDGSHNPPKCIVKSEYLMLSSKNIFDNKITMDDPRYLSKEDFEKENKRTKVMPGDVLLTIVGTVGRAAVVRESMPDFTLQRSVAVLHPNKDICNSRYLMYALQSRRSYINSRAKGVAQKGVYLKEISNINLKMMTLLEQKNVVNILDKVMSIIAFRQQELQKLDSLVRSRFVEMFGDPIINEKEWPCIILSDACQSILGGGTPSKSCNEFFSGTIPWVTPKDMKLSIINDSIDHITEDAIKYSTTNLVPKESVLMVIRSGILKHSLPVAMNSIPVTINQDMKAFIPGKNITAEFLLHFFKAIENDILSGVRSVTADNIDFKTFQKRMIIIPPLDLQQQFAAFIAQVDKSKVAVQKIFKISRFNDII